MQNSLLIERKRQKMFPFTTSLDEETAVINKWLDLVALFWVTPERLSNLLEEINFQPEGIPLQLGIHSVSFSPEKQTLRVEIKGQAEDQIRAIRVYEFQVTDEIVVTIETSLSNGLIIERGVMNYSLEAFTWEEFLSIWKC